MFDALVVFVAGLGGVFLGMTLLYTSIRLTTIVTCRLIGKKEEK